MNALAATLLLSGCATLHGSSAPPVEQAPPADEPGAGWSAIVQQAMPSVVLLLAEVDGEPRRFGAGIVVDGEGRVLTNHHIVAGARSISVLAHEPGRTSYSPLEGGIDRLVFQHQHDLLEASTVAGDPLLDLALLQVDGLEAPAVLPQRAEPLLVGEPVLALGHPQQSAWSFTAGVVGALHQGLIQHDAPLNPGNSGGPLIDAEGRLVGVNTLELIGTEGMAYARPVALARPLLEGGARAIELDLTAPDSAYHACERAVDLAPWQALDCIWWDGEYQQLLQAAERVRAALALPGEVDRALEHALWEHSRSAWIGAWQQGVVRFLSGGVYDLQQQPQRLLDYDALWPEEAARQTHRAAIGAPALIRERWAAMLEDERAYQRARAERGGLDEPLDPGPARQARALGQRLQELYLPTDRMALLHVQAHAPDGTLYGTTECWVLVPGGWRQRMVCPDSYAQRIPADWPLPVEDHALFLERFELELAMAILGVSAEDLDL